MRGDLLERIRAFFSTGYERLARRAAAWRQAGTALLEKARTEWERAVSAFLEPPSGPESYFSLGERLVSKRLALLVLAGALSAAAVLAAVVYPRLDGWLWSSRLVVGSEKLSGFTGRAELFTAGGARVYVGPIADGQLTGQGEQYAQDGQLVYSGAFVSGRYEGTGRYYENGVLRYAGYFLNSLFEGEGEQYDEQGRLLYWGSFSQGRRNGTGTQFQPDTGLKCYTGAFFNDLREGRGTEYGPDGSTVVYEGAFVGGAYGGAGRLYSGGVLLYDGAFERGAFSGTGTLYDADTGGVLYSGGFLAGRYEGEGMLYDIETAVPIYSGAFAAGVRAGKGVEYDSLGWVLFAGNFRDDMPDLMHYLGEDLEGFRADFGPENARRTVGGKLLLFYTEQGLAVVCRADGAEGYLCEKMISGLATELAGVCRGADAAAVHDALGLPYTALSLDLDLYYGAAFSSVGAGIRSGAPVPGEKYLRGGYFIRVYYSAEGGVAAVELCATGGGL